MCRNFSSKFGVDILMQKFIKINFLMRILMLTAEMHQTPIKHKNLFDEQNYFQKFSSRFELDGF